MRTLFAAIATLLALTSAVVSVGRPWLLRRDAFTFNPTNIRVRELVQHKPIVLTNAQRLALGLAPARPHFRSSKLLSTSRGSPRRP